VDLLGQEFGWEIENFINVTKTSALMVNEENIAIFQDSGERNWWNLNNLPKNVTLVDKLEETSDEKFKGCLIITDKLVTNKNILSKSVIYRPKTLVVGVGVHWNTTKKEIFDGLTSVLEKNMLSFSCIKALTSIKKKTDVKGLFEFSKEHKLPLQLYTKEELDGIGVPNPSDVVKKYEQVASIAEASSLLYSNGSLIVQKQKFPPNLTIAIATMG